MTESHNRSLHWFVVLMAATWLVLFVMARPTAGSWVAVTPLLIIMTVWVGRAACLRSGKILASAALAGVALQAVAQFLMAAAFFAACLAQIVFAMLAALVVLSSSSWRREPHTVLDGGWPSLRSLSITTAALIFLDTIFGAAFEHQLLGPVLHIATAMAATVVAVMLCIFLLTQHSGHESLRQSAMALLAVTPVQVFLGVAEYMRRLRVVRASSPDASAAVLSLIHTAAGALTLAAAVALAMQVSRNVRKPAGISLSSPRSVGTI